ncbi:hypothetical protein [Nonomuraea sp. NPDC002799]
MKIAMGLRLAGTVLLAAVAVLGVSACGGDTSGSDVVDVTGSPPDSQEPSSSPTATKKKKKKKEPAEVTPATRAPECPEGGGDQVDPACPGVGPEAVPSGEITGPSGEITGPPSSEPTGSPEPMTPEPVTPEVTTPEPQET